MSEIAVSIYSVQITLSPLWQLHAARGGFCLLGEIYPSKLVLINSNRGGTDAK
jgi:hypothetical protein